ncbi:MAG TPA: capsule assembly Wzi family protein, partial [Longimicrobiales bacterium]|nr:capsule assembly Wzi family protein [Longimicrobiales bacterium]
NRGAIFGGEGNPITVGRLLGLLIGLHGGEAGEFENQVFSTIMKIRPPLGPLGVEFYAEVGMDDTAGAISDVPGIVAGVDVGVVPGLPALSLAVEHTDFPHNCCNNTIWYRNGFFRGSWGDEGRLFAHPLGGHGREWLAHTRIDLPRHGLTLRTQAFTRDRGNENLFAPEREGRSRGGSATLEYSHRSGIALRADADVERGDTWRSHRAALLLSYAFVRR